MQKLVIAIPTYNSADIIDETLSLECEYWKDKNVDIHIYDSSTDAKTSDVVTKWKDNGYDNLYYIRIDSTIHSNKKVYMIYRDLSGCNRYDFIWMRRDYTSYTTNTCEILLGELRDDVSIINIRKSDADDPGVRYYTDRNLYAKKYMVITTCYGDCILNVKTMLSDIDWGHYEKKYIESKAINFSHVGLYFELLAKHKNVNMCNLGIDRSGYNDSKLKINSYWMSDVMRIYATGWGELIQKLSEYYEGLYELCDFSNSFFTVEKLIRYRNENVLNIRILWRNRKWAKKCIGANYSMALKLALMPKRKVGKFVEEMNRDNIGGLNQFVKRYENVYIYGIRKYGKFTYEQISCKEKVKAFIKTNPQAGENQFEGKEVIPFEQFLQIKSDGIGVIVAAGEDTRAEILSLLEKNGITGNVFVNRPILGKYGSVKSI